MKRISPIGFRGALLATGLIGTSGGLLTFLAQDRFIHEAHEGLFPVCESCHAGIVEDDTANFFTIAPQDCAKCHDGTDRRRVDWRGPTREPSNLIAFPHRFHIKLEQLECGDCHNPTQAERMTVERAVVTPCLGCHADRASGHFDLGAIDCTKCHVTLAQATSLSTERIAKLPRPPNHGQPGFRRAHAALAQTETGDCAICHARESCERCHRNAARIPPIMALGRDPRVAELVAAGAFGPSVPAERRAEPPLLDPRNCRPGLPCRLRESR